MINNKRSYTEYNITSPTTDFAIGFENYGVGAKDIIEVTLNGVLVESLGHTVRLKNAQVLEVTPAIEAGTVRLQRVTGIDGSFHKFTAGALFTAKSMDDNFKQIRHSQQEVKDGFNYLEFNTNSVIGDARAATVRANAAAGVVEGLTATVNSRVSAVEVSQEATIQRVDNFIATDVVPIVNDAINNTAVEGGVLADTFVTVTANGVGTIARTQRSKNKDSISPFDFGAIGDGLYHPLSERFNSLSDAQTQYPRATALTASIDYHATQAFLDECSANHHPNADISIDAAITHTLEYKGRYPATKVINGDLILRGVKDHPLNHCLIWQGNFSQLTGSVTIFGYRDADNNIKSRETNHGVLVGSWTVTAEKNEAIGAKINSVNAHFIKGYACILAQKAHFAGVGYIHASRCGSTPAGSTGYKLTANWSNKQDINPLTFDGKSTVSVDQLPFVTINEMQTGLGNIEDLHAVINNEIYVVNDIDRVNNKITVTPQITTTDSTGTLGYIQGGALLVWGNDVANTSVDRINAILSGCCSHLLSLYGTQIQSATSEFCGAGVLWNSRSAINMGSSITSAYFEGNTFDLVEGWNQKYNNLVIKNTMAIDAKKLTSLHTFLKPDRVRAVDNAYSRITTEIRVEKNEYAPQAPRIDISTKNDSIIYNTDSGQIEIACNNDLVNAYGKQSLKLTLASKSQANGSPSGTVTLKSVDGFTINNASTLVIAGSSYNSAIDILLRRVSETNIDAKVLTKLCKKSYRVDFGNTKLNGFDTIVVNISGAKMGDMVSISFDRAIGSTLVTASVTQANEVTIYTKNIGADASSIPSAALADIYVG